MIGGTDRRNCLEAFSGDYAEDFLPAKLSLNGQENGPRLRLLAGWTAVGLQCPTWRVNSRRTQKSRSQRVSGTLRSWRKVLRSPG